MESGQQQEQEEEFSLLAFSPLINISGFQDTDLNFFHEFNAFSFPIDVDPTMPPPPTPKFSGEDEEEMKRKRNHSEKEKMRRLNLKSLFASLSSVLPDAHKLKMLGAPSTVDRVMEYIPQLRKEVEELKQRKQQLDITPLVTTTNDVVFSQAPAAWTKANGSSSSCSKASSTCSSHGEASYAAWSVQVNEIGNREIVIQISASKFLINTFIPISEVLRMLEEEDGLIIVEVCSSDSFTGRVFYHLRLMEADPDTHKIECEFLRNKLLSSCKKWEEMCLWMITQGT